jgi:hypothetical protein
MENQFDYSDLLQFFRAKPPALPGDPEYNSAFCKTLVQASSSEEASIWQLDSRNQLHPVYGTNFTSEDVKDVILREGEGIGGAVVLSRQTMAVYPGRPWRFQRLPQTPATINRLIRALVFRHGP